MSKRKERSDLDPLKIGKFIKRALDNTLRGYRVEFEELDTQEEQPQEQPQEKQIQQTDEPISSSIILNPEKVGKLLKKVAVDATNNTPSTELGSPKKKRGRAPKNITPSSQPTAGKEPRYSPSKGSEKGIYNIVII